MTYQFNLIFMAVAIALLFGGALGAVAYLILLERRIAAFVQDRLGPNRVGPFGLLQPIADGVKFLLKEDVLPGHVNKVVYLLAPAIAASTALFVPVVIPFGATTAAPSPPWPKTVAQAEEIKAVWKDDVKAYDQQFQFVIAPHVDVGLVLVFSISSMAVYGVILGGWASNNKYSMLGGIRASAQIISYEIPLGLAAVTAVLLTGTLNLERMIDYQARSGMWLIFYQPLAFSIFLVSVFAECNRLPFDLSECEQELVGGFHTEYSSMKFALFFLGEYTHMVSSSFLVAVLFLGGWHLTGISEVNSPWMIKTLVLLGKMFALIVFFMLIRWTIPRFRFDQLMALSWKGFIPLTVLNLVCLMFVLHYELPRWLLLPISIMLMILAAALTINPGRRINTPDRSRVDWEQLGIPARGVIR